MSTKADGATQARSPSEGRSPRVRSGGYGDAMTTDDEDAVVLARAMVETDPAVAEAELRARLRLFDAPNDPDEARSYLIDLDLDALVGRLRWKPGYVPSEGDLDLNRERLEIERSIALALIRELPSALPGFPASDDALQ